MSAERPASERDGLGGLPVSPYLLRRVHGLRAASPHPGVDLVADGADAPHDVDVAPVFGPLLFGGRPAGLFSRFFGDGTAGIVSILGTRSSDDCVVAV